MRMIFIYTYNAGKAIRIMLVDYLITMHRFINIISIIVITIAMYMIDVKFYVYNYIYLICMNKTLFIYKTFFLIIKNAYIIRSFYPSCTKLIILLYFNFKYSFKLLT